MRGAKSSTLGDWMVPGQWPAATGAYTERRLLGERAHRKANGPLHLGFCCDAPGAQLESPIRRVAADAQPLESESPMRVGLENISCRPRMAVLCTATVLRFAVHRERVIPDAQPVIAQLPGYEHEAGPEWPAQVRATRRDIRLAVQPLCD